MARLLLSLTIILISFPVLAETRSNISQIGPHEPIFTFEKNENPQNVMVIYAKVDDQCRFLPVVSKTSEKSPVDFYWLMDRKSFKPVNPLIKNAMRERLSLAATPQPDSRSFEVRINDLKELKTDLNDFKIDVKSVADKSKSCDVEATVTLGPSDHDRVLRLETIRSESKKTFLPPFRKLISITLEGKDIKTGEHVKRTYQGRS